ncbi:MAG: transcriptional regulator [Firmicutes bacterium]|nr:transcriptional regulator [Bacillota bacterium]
MSRISNALNVFFLLQSRGKMTVEELAQQLEVTPRMIKKYKKDLEMAGIYIGTQRGKYGGYYIERNRTIENVGLTKDELNALKMAMETIKSGSYHYSSKFEILSSKILNLETYKEKQYYYNKLMKESDEIVEKERSIWIDINLAINNRNKVSMEYKSLKPDGLEIKERLVNPYGIFDYKGATYFYGYCETAQDIRFFKLSRIMEYQIMKEKFDVKLEYDLKESLAQSYGIYNDDTVDLKLKIFYPMSEIIKEKSICNNQKITQIDEKTIYFEAMMNGYTEIKTWIMSMGSSVEVVKPAELRNYILSETKKIAKLYN